MIEFSEAIRALALNLALLKGDPTAHDLLQSKDFTCIAVTVFAEARGEGSAGMALVAQSIVNRARIQNRPACKITQGAYDGYRLWKYRDPRYTDQSNWAQAQLIAINVIMGEINLGNCRNVTHFLNPAAVQSMPRWASKKNKICRLGKHSAYRVINL